MDHPSIFLGIDVSSRFLDLWLSPSADPHCRIPYSEQALDAFLNKHPELTPDTGVVGVESTGVYHLAVTKYFLKKDFQVKILNAILTKQYSRTTIRGIKTDKSDAEIITTLLQAGHGEPACLRDILNNRKELLRISKTIIQHTTALKLLAKSVIKKDLPESPTMAEELQGLVETMEDLSHRFIDQATDVRSEDEILIDSIPGFSVRLSAVIHHEIGDIQRFNGVKSLVAFAGLDPRVRQSGSLLNATGRLSKRGSSYLRDALFLAANVARLHDDDLRMYYQKKRGEGRKHTEVLCMIARKLLARVYAVLKERRIYFRSGYQQPTDNMTLTET